MELVGAGNFEIPTNWVRTSYSASELRSHNIAVIYSPTARGYLQIADKFWYLFHVGPVKALIDIPGTKDYHLLNELRNKFRGENSALAVYL